jgi:hypothetical protein
MQKSLLNGGGFGSVQLVLLELVKNLQMICQVVEYQLMEP